MSFLSEYRSYVSGNEANENFHLWSAIACLSAIVSRRVWVPQGIFTIYPNMYVVLVGPAGSRKTTAMGVCKDFIRSMADIPMSAEAITKAALVREMAENTQHFKIGEDTHTMSPMTVCVTELSNFLGVDAAQMIDFLTTIYDEKEYKYKTKGKTGDANRSEDKVVGPHLTFLACTTPSWISNYLKSDVIGGGFCRRAMFIYETEQSGIVPFPELTPEQEAAKVRAIIEARQIQEIKGPFIWTPEAKAFYSKWYIDHRMWLKAHPEDSLSGYHESKHAQLLKLMMLMTLSEMKDLVVRKSVLEACLHMLTLTERNLGKVFLGMGRNELAASASAILDMLGRTGGILPFKQLRSATFNQVNSKEFYEVMQHLQNSDQILKFTGSTTSDPTPREYVILPTRLEELRVSHGLQKPSAG